MFVELSSIARASLGYKSLQNNFFYLNQPTIDTYGVEKKYLTPILMLRDLNGRAYSQSPPPSLWLFNCKDTKADLRGTGALRYIDAMADRSAADKKQTGKNLTIREALEAQGGSVWYAPKARPVAHNVWLRKAFDGVFSPLLFTKPALVDQRCNSLAPVAGIDWQEVAAVLTCSLFAYSLEINGSASMGAGALEAPTTKLRDYPVLNVAKLKAAERAKLVALAQDVWSSEQPLDWSKPEATPGPKLRALDDWIMKRTGRNITVATLYRDIQEVCLSRIAVAADKGKKTKKKHSENIGGVAESIAKAIRPKIQLRNFPEDFVRGEILDMNFNIDRRKVRTINVSQLLGTYDIAIIDDAGTKIFEATLPSPVAESIARSVLWGRSDFSLSSDAKIMNRALSEFLKWAVQIEKNVSTAIAESALGTGYEDALRREIYARLGIHPLASVATLPNQISLAAPSLAG